MNEEAQQTLTEILQRILDGVDATVAFGTEHLPDVIQQLLTWHFIESLLWFSLSLAWVIAGVCGVWYIASRKPIPLDGKNDDWLKYKRDLWFDSQGDMQGTQMLVLVPILAAIVGATCATENLAWMKIWLSPKLYLLEYGATLVK